MTITDDSDARKNIPLARGVLDYFPAALAEVARLSQAGNDKHNPGEELHHARGKSTDHADCILRHLVDRGTIDTDGFLHDVKVAWRALAQLQEALEERGAEFARGAQADADYLEDLEDLRAIHAANEAMMLDPAVLAVRDRIKEAVLSVLTEDEEDVERDAYGRPLGSTPAFTFTDDELRDLRLDEERDRTVYRVADILDGTQELPADEEGFALWQAHVDSLYCANAISNRIAGDSPEARALKNPYYNHDPHVIVGYCANCDDELKVDDEHLVNNSGFDKSVIFCSLGCRVELVEWQKGLR